MKTEKFDPGLNIVRKALESRESGSLSEYSAKSCNAVRRINDERLEKSYRLAYAADTDRILNSLAYTRYIDKTQVFSLVRNDHITHRVLHVQLVSRIGRTIGRALGLNEDLIEAISLGHDIGHVPFGHDGENILSKITESYSIGKFHHNIQSARFLEYVEKNGEGLNLTLQTLDGIICHNGEKHNKKLMPLTNKTFEDIDFLIGNKGDSETASFIPMSLEGCVVRQADTISYLGRDIEDAIRLGIITRLDLPQDLVVILGDTNGTIVYSLVTDVIANSFEKGCIEYSEEISDAVCRLRQFNYSRIYTNKKIKKHLHRVKEIYYYLFDKFMTDLLKGNEESPVFKNYLSSMNEKYLKNNSNPEITRDFIAGMTDNYFLSLAPDNLRP